MYRALPVSSLSSFVHNDHEQDRTSAITPPNNYSQHMKSVLQRIFSAVLCFIFPLSQLCFLFPAMPLLPNFNSYDEYRPYSSYLLKAFLHAPVELRGLDRNVPPDDGHHRPSDRHPHHRDRRWYPGFVGTEVQLGQEESESGRLHGGLDRHRAGGHLGEAHVLGHLMTNSHPWEKNHEKKIDPTDMTIKMWNWCYIFQRQSM